MVEGGDGVGPEGEGGSGVGEGEDRGGRMVLGTGYRVSDTGGRNSNLFQSRLDGAPAEPNMPRILDAVKLTVRCTRD